MLTFKEVIRREIDDCIYEAVREAVDYQQGKVNEHWGATAMLLSNRTAEKIDLITDTEVDRVLQEILREGRDGTSWRELVQTKMRRLSKP